MTRIVYGVVGIIYDGDQFLLLKKKGRWVGWQFVQGKIDPGESEEQALLREVEEETGLASVSITAKLDCSVDYWFTQEGERIHKFLTYVLVRGDKRHPVVLSVEHSEAKWCGYDEVMRDLRYNTEVFEHAYRQLGEIFEKQ